MSTTPKETGSSRPPTGATTPREIRLFNKPSYLLLITAGTIFVGEVLVMMILQSWPPLSPLKGAMFDAVLLAVMMFPSLYFFVFKPLNQHIAQRRRAELEKDRLIAELHRALSEVKTLRGIVPICASCKKIRDDQGFWQQVEVYMRAHSDAQFTHGICPECTEKLYADFTESYEQTIAQPLAPDPKKKPRG